MSSKKEEHRVWYFTSKHGLGTIILLLLFVIFGMYLWTNAINTELKLTKEKNESLKAEHAFQLKDNNTKWEKILEEYKERDIPTDILILYLQPKVDPELAMIIGKYVDMYSEKYRLPKNLVLAIIFAESSFNPFATSKVGAIGLTQVFPKAHPDKIEELEDTKELYHISTNIDIGCKIFRGYFDAKEGNLTNTFNAYLSMNATKEELWKYKNNILDAWAKLDMYYYQLEKKKEGNEK